MSRSWIRWGVGAGWLLCSSMAIGAPTHDDPESAWEAALEDAVRSARAVDPTLEDAVRDAIPRRTRSGRLRFLGDATEAPDALPFLIERLRAGGDAPAVRVALADAISRALPGDGAWTLALFEGERDPEVRVVLLGGLVRAPAAISDRAIRAGFVDSSAQVRAQAARDAGKRERSDAVSSELARLVADADSETRAGAIRSLGWLGRTDAWGAVVGSLSDGDPAVRLQAASALHRLDPTRARLLLEPLAGDEDPSVRAFVHRLGASDGSAPE